MPCTIFHGKIKKSLVALRESKPDVKPSSGESAHRPCINYELICQNPRHSTGRAQEGRGARQRRKQQDNFKGKAGCCRAEQRAAARRTQGGERYLEGIVLASAGTKPKTISMNVFVAANAN